MQISKCSSDRDCYPGFKYTCCFFLPGVAVICGGLFCFLVLERESNYQFVHSAWQISMAVAILFLLPQTPTGQGMFSNDNYEMTESKAIFITLAEDKYAVLNPHPATAYTAVDTSFKHYPDDSGPGGAPPEVINVTSNASATILPPDQVIDVSRAPSLATLNGASAGTLPRASTLRHSHNHHNNPSTSTLKRDPTGQQMPYEPG